MFTVKSAKNWWSISLILCVFGFLKELRPSEPFIYEFLTGEWRNLTSNQITQEVYPFAVYSNLALLILVFLITDFCRYKPLLTISPLCGIVVWSMLLWTTTLLALQIVEVFYGGFLALDVVYFSYIYAKVDNEHFQKVTSHARAAALAGRFFSSMLGQLLVSFKLMSYKGLNYITLSAMIVALLWSFFIPSVNTSIYFHSGNKLDLSFIAKTKLAIKLLAIHLKQSFSQLYVVKWSIWWALTTGVFLQIQNYIQPIWQEIDNSKNSYNGAVEAFLTIVGCLGALSVGYIKIDWAKIGDLTLSFLSFISAALIIFSSQANTVTTSYICYVFYGGFYHCMITISTTEIAKHIPADSYGLVFGINTFVALSISTILTLTVVSGSWGWALSIRDQHLSYGYYHIVITLLFLIIGLTHWLKSDHR